MNRINTGFRRQKSAFISYLVCGDPDLNTTLKIIMRFLQILEYSKEEILTFNNFF